MNIGESLKQSFIDISFSSSCLLWEKMEPVKFSPKMRINDSLMNRVTILINPIYYDIDKKYS
jgi:hypothetical protein